MDGLAQDKQTVQMDIGVGVFDVKEKLGGLLEKQQPKEMSTSKRLDESLPHGMGYHQTSTQPILRYLPNEKVAKEDNEDSDESSSSHDENLFVEFDSSDDEKESNQQ